MSRDSLIAAGREGGAGGAGNEVARPVNLSRDSLLAARREITDQALFDFAAEVGSEGPVVVLGGGTQQGVGLADALHEACADNGKAHAVTQQDAGVVNALLCVGGARSTQSGGVGGASKDAVGVSAPEAKIVRAPTGIVEVCADDMTVCVRAGTPVAELHQALAEYGMRTSLVDDTFSPNSQGSTGRHTTLVNYHFSPNSQPSSGMHASLGDDTFSPNPQAPAGMRDPFVDGTFSANSQAFAGMHTTFVNDDFSANPQASTGMPTSSLGDAISVRSQGSTVGGVIAVGRSPITRLADGHLREAVLQIRYVAADGSLVTAGGPTVKNVSGFDLCRLMVGSLGTLGCIADVTLRTLPIYPHKQWVRVEGVEPRFVLEEATTATAILWNKKTVWAQLAGHAVDVEDDLALFKDYAFETPPPLPPHRWSRQPHELFELGDETGECVAEIGVGVVHCEFPDPKRKQMSAGVLALNRRVREVFDPRRRFNPARSVELM